MQVNDIVVVSAIRTPMGRFGGTLRDVSACDLGAHVIAAALRHAGVTAAHVDEVILGQCRQAGNGPNPSRTASVRAGIPMSVPTQTINKACPSAMKTLVLASQTIRLGEAGLVVAGGMDSMSTIPYLLKGARWQGFKIGDRVLEDGWNDSIDPLCNMGMGQTAEKLAAETGLSREEQDRFALESHLKAAAAQDNGWFDDEIVPLSIPQRRGDPVVFDRDETIRRDSTLEKLARLPPVFEEAGSVTAGNACQMADGAAAMVVTSRDRARELGVRPLFSLVSHSSIGVDAARMGEGPGVSIPAALERAGKTLKEVDLIEVNEAFAVQALANERVLGWDRSKVNVHGGAIALGHPTGVSGARILVTLYHALRRCGGEYGVAGICGGGGVSMAMVIRREDGHEGES